MAKKKVCEHQHKVGGLLVLAGLFIGIGVGMILQQTVASALIGLGGGFLAAFIAHLVLNH
ncbi:hypothetical protein ACFLZN_02140 [Nanoarchaeota archaeon]